MSTTTASVPSTDVVTREARGNGELVKVAPLTGYPVYSVDGNVAPAFSLVGSAYLEDIERVLLAVNEKSGDYQFSTALLIFASNPEVVTVGGLDEEITDGQQGNVVGTRKGREYESIVKWGNLNARMGRRCTVVTCERRRVKVTEKDATTGKDVTKFYTEFHATNVNGFRPSTKK